MMFSYLLIRNIPFHYQTLRFPIDKEIAVAYPGHVVAWQCLKPHQPLFHYWFAIIGLHFDWETLGVLGTDLCNYIQYINKGFQFLLDMSGLCFNHDSHIAISSS